MCYRESVDKDKRQLSQKQASRQAGKQEGVYTCDRDENFYIFSCILDRNLLVFTIVQLEADNRRVHEGREIFVPSNWIFWKTYNLCRKKCVL